MKITRVEIDNFRGIQSFAMDLTDSSGKPLDMVVLAGENGSGKTSIIEACVCQCGGADLVRSKPNDQARILVKDNYGLEFVNGVRWEATDDFPIEVEPKCRSEYLSSWRWPHLGGSLSISVGRKVDVPDPMEQNWLLTVKQFFGDVAARKGFPSGADSASRELALYEKLNNLWRRFYPESQEKWLCDVAGDVGQGFDLFLVGRVPDTRIPLDALSSGEIEIFAMIGWFLTHETELDLLFIDEPELHLHPSWHRAILPTLRDLLPNTQIIAATHSPQVLSSVPDENIRLLKRNGGTIEVIHPSASFGLDSNQILENLMGTDERPPEIKQRLKDLFLAIDTDRLEEARKTLAELRETVHADPAFIKAEALIHRKEILGR